ncbi:MAG: tripartite tricarboxylate transporter substrate binding protein [Xanthobacteraceae bacterium]
MKLPRRKFLYLAAGAPALPLLSRSASGQAYPTRPVRLIVGFPAGGTVDLIARLIGQGLSKKLGEPFVIKNEAGAAGNIATEDVVHAAPDGYTLLTSTTANASSVILSKELVFDFLHEIAPVGSICRVPFVMVVNPLFPSKTVPEFIAYAKANPGKVNMASPGFGTPSHVAGELFKVMTGVNMVHVPYRGEPAALSDLIDGQVQVLFGTLPGLIAQIRAQKLRALAVANATRLEILPNVPTIHEFLPGYEVAASIGIGAPHDTPAEVIGQLNSSINADLVEPEIKAQLAYLGAPTLSLSSAEYGKLIADEIKNWGKSAREAGIKAE